MRTLVLSLPVLALATLSLPAPAAAANWFGCPKNYRLQADTKKGIARCFRTPRTQIWKPGPGCAGIKIPGFSVGAGLKVNAQGQADKCVVANTNKRADPLCPPNYKLVVRPRKDLCVRKINHPVKPVTVRR